MLSQRVEDSLAPVVARWANQDKELLWPLFPKIHTGQSAWESELADRFNRDTVDIGHALEGSLATLDSAGRVTELFGITREQTLHQINVNGHALFSCCALVAHTAAAIFRRPAAIISRDPVSGGDVRITISEGLELLDVDPEASYGSLVDCEPADLLENPRTIFCCHVKHFTSAESGAEFCSQDSRRYLVSIEDFHAAAQKLFHRIWGSQPGRQGIRNNGDDRSKT